MKDILLSVLESDLVEWFKIAQAKELAITALIKEKVHQLAKKLTVKHFFVPNSWIDIYMKMRRSIKENVLSKVGY